MHRIPLKLESPAVTWDRHMDESELFARTMNPANIQETTTFVELLDEAAEYHDSQRSKNASKYFVRATRYLANIKMDYTNSVIGVYCVNMIILSGPKHSTTLAWALKTRGDYFFRLCCFHYASRDYEMYLYVGKVALVTQEELCITNGHLVICTYLNKEYEKSKKYLKAYRGLKRQLGRNILKTPLFENIENYINNFSIHSRDMHAFSPALVNSTMYDEAMKKGKCEMLYEAQACSFEGEGVYASSTISASDCVFIEKPLFYSLDVPFIQCEVCFSLAEIPTYYTCLDCRYKTYCSVDCLLNDQQIHEYECIAYKQLILLVLDAKHIFRIFLKILLILEKQVLNRKNLTSLTNATNVLEKIYNIVNTTNVVKSDYLDFIKYKPYYDNLLNMQYSTIVTTAFRLTIFIDKKTEILQKFFKALTISHSEKLIVVGSLLMRIHGNILTHSLDIQFPVTSAKVDFRIPMERQIQAMNSIIKPKSEGGTDDVEKFYEADFDDKMSTRREPENTFGLQNWPEEVMAVPLYTLRHTEPCQRIQRSMLLFIDDLSELFFHDDITEAILYGELADGPKPQVYVETICKRISKLSDCKRYWFLKSFATDFHKHCVAYFLHKFQRSYELKQVSTIYCSMVSKFNHSCIPNVELIVLQNGMVLGKALQNIKQGTELNVAYKSHYMRHSQSERQAFLNDLKIQCFCEFCLMSQMDDPINIRQSIYCELCPNTLITPTQFACPNCHASYDYLMDKYRILFNILENKVAQTLMAADGSKNTERDIYIMYKILYSKAKEYLGAANEMRIEIELKYSHFLAIKNFAKLSYEILKDIHKNILKNYDENIVWFTFYVTIMKTLKIILHYNLEQKLTSISNQDLYELCKLGIHIANGRKNYIEFHEVFDQNCIPILDDLGAFQFWKEKILRRGFQIQ